MNNFKLKYFYKDLVVFKNKEHLFRKVDTLMCLNCQKQYKRIFLNLNKVKN